MNDITTEMIHEYMNDIYPNKSYNIPVRRLGDKDDEYYLLVPSLRHASRLGELFDRFDLNKNDIIEHLRNKRLNKILD